MNNETLLYDLTDSEVDRCDGPLYAAVTAAGYQQGVRQTINQKRCWHLTVAEFLTVLGGEKPDNGPTQGPWQLSNGTDSIDLMGNNGQTLIASFPIPAKEDGVAYIPGEEDAANLRLIAASPQLLAAVSGILACCGMSCAVHRLWKRAWSEAKRNGFYLS